MMTGYGYKANPDNPVDAVIRKPFDFAQLRTVTNQILNGVEDKPDEAWLAELHQFN
jgi:hypothetical protein